MNKIDFESLNNLLKKITEKDNFDRFDIEQAKILLAKIKFEKSKLKEMK